jgi:hypothetical protein
MRTTKAQQRFEEAMQSDANRHFPWPSWILEWVLEEHRGKLGPDAAQRIRNPTG